jgi:truncated hemoglobin YjbI
VSAPSPDSPPGAGTVYGYLGPGATAMAAARWSDAVFADEALAPIFRRLGPGELARVRASHAGSLRSLLGGAPYRGVPLDLAHAPHPITMRDFDHVRAHLATALASVGCTEIVIDRVMGQVAALAGQVVTVRTPR